MSEHTLKLTTDEIEALREVIDENWDEENEELKEIRYKIAVIREEPLYK